MFVYLCLSSKNNKLKIQREGVISQSIPFLLLKPGAVSTFLQPLVLTTSVNFCSYFFVWEPLTLEHSAIASSVSANIRYLILLYTSCLNRVKLGGSNNDFANFLFTLS